MVVRAGAGGPFVAVVGRDRRTRGCGPDSGVRRRWRWAAGAGGVVAAGMLYATMALVASRAEDVGAYETVDQAMWTINAAAVVAAVVLLLRRHAAHRRDR